jgi:hypothetical protein
MSHTCRHISETAHAKARSQTQAIGYSHSRATSWPIACLTPHGYAHRQGISVQNLPRHVSEIT